MPLPISIILNLTQTCAPAISPRTMGAVVLAESGGDPLAIRINRPAPARLRPRDREQAISLATGLLARGANLDLGLGQINSRNLGRLGMSVEAAFDACRNLDGAARILAADYSRSKPGALTEQAALKTALSLYNTGDRGRGLRNGYIAKVAAAQRTVPELEADQNTDLPATAAIPPTWDVFAALEPVTAGFVLHPQKAGGLH